MPLDGAYQQLANDPKQLATLRQTLRDRLRTHLCDGVTFTRNLEGLYRTIWRRWCCHEGGSGD
jgi:predicted O-linked N-acetylglucosamine transferase (SPINDLY family)